MTAEANQATFQSWIEERHHMYLRKEVGLMDKPYSLNKFMGAYRYCNVYRQLDRTTQWISTRWLNCPPARMPLRAIIARFINDPEVLEALRPACNPFNADMFLSILNARKTVGLRVRSAAYMTTTHGATTPWTDFTTKEVLAPLADLTVVLDPRHYDGLDGYARKLMTFNGIGSFLAGQVVADLKYHHPRMSQVCAPDWWTFVVPGPGSRRGLHRLYGIDPARGMSDAVFHKLFPLAQKLATEVVMQKCWPQIHAQDVQNCLCEFDKYMRLVDGTGSPKQRY